jgi:hypothetical protein
VRSVWSATGLFIAGMLPTITIVSHLSDENV